MWGLMAFDYNGLSPRGRGNRLAASKRTSSMRSIPAWAGQPPNVGLRGL